MPSNKEVFREKKQRNFLAKLGYDLERHIELPHPMSKSFLLHDAVVAGRVDIIKRLIAHNADLNRPDGNVSDECRHQRSPLILALFEHKEKVARLLLENKADPESWDNYTKVSALMLAARNATSNSIMGLLLECKANIDRENLDPLLSRPEEKHMTALMYAANAGLFSSTFFLIEQGAAVVNSQGRHAFSWSSEHVLSGLEKESQAFIDQAQAFLQGTAIYIPQYVLSGLKKKSQVFVDETQALRQVAAFYLPPALVDILCSYTLGDVLLKNGLLEDGESLERVVQKKLSAVLEQKKPLPVVAPFSVGVVTSSAPAGPMSESLALSVPKVRPRGQWAVAKNWTAVFKPPVVCVAKKLPVVPLGVARDASARIIKR